MSQKVKKLEHQIELKINQIDIGDRYRVDMGDIESLALSMDVKGLLYPVIVALGEAGRYNLVEGERRIRAAKLLGWTKIDCMLLHQMEALQRKELELIMCVQRKDLDFVEEARAVRDLVNRRREAALKGGLARFSSNIRNKDVALELNMHESRLSECLRIASAVDEHPELETECKTRSDCLRRIRKQDFYVPDGGYLQSKYGECLIHSSARDCVSNVQDKIVDLAILHLDTVDEALLADLVVKLKLAGQLIIFGTTRSLIEWEDACKKFGLHTGERPYMWHVKGEDDYVSFIWAGKNRKVPLRPIPAIIGYARPEPRLSVKAKPTGLISQLVKCCTDRHGFVLVPLCEDIETVRCCVDITRNIRAACPDKMLREKIILSVTEDV